MIPAIDLRGGRVVRLQQGSFDRERVYGDDPAAVARAFRGAGAAWIHVVDLDGARTGRRANSAQVVAIIQAATAAGEGSAANVEVAGGLRDAAAVRTALAAGASRVVLGTAILQDPGLAHVLVEEHGPDRIAVALDVRDGQAVGDGWVPGAPGTPALEALEALMAAGIVTFVVTAIARDGLLGGPDLALMDHVLHASEAAIIASGGIASIDDLVAVRDIGCRGAIVGRAIHDGRMDLGAAIDALAATTATTPATPTARPPDPSRSR